MFAPQGFMSLDEVFGRLADEADKWRLSTPNPDDPKPGGEFLEGSFFPVDVNYSRSLAYCHWLFQCFLNRHETELYATVPAGQAVKLSPSLGQRFKFWEGPFEDTKNSWESIVDHVKDSFTFISPVGFIVSTKQAEKWLKEEDLKEMRDTLKMIDACPVCWKLPSEIPVIDWSKACGVSEEGTISKESLSPSSIKKRILQQKEANPLLSRDEIKELVAPTVSFRQYKISWGLAVHENPELAKPGRKSR